MSHAAYFLCRSCNANMQTLQLDQVRLDDHDWRPPSAVHTLHVADHNEPSIQAREVGDVFPVLFLQFLYGHPHVLGYSFHCVAGCPTKHDAILIGGVLDSFVSSLQQLSCCVVRLWVCPTSMGLPPATCRRWANRHIIAMDAQKCATHSRNKVARKHWTPKNACTSHSMNGRLCNAIVRSSIVVPHMFP
jgi:hypothetical protein